MQRAAAITTSALRRLAVEAISRPPVLSRAASLASPSFPRPLAALSLDLHRLLTTSLLPPALQPCRGYVRHKVPSEEEEFFDEDDSEDDFDSEDLDGLEDVDGKFDEFESGDEEMPDDSV